MILHYIPIEQATIETQCERGVRSQGDLAAGWTGGWRRVRTSVIGSVDKSHPIAFSPSVSWSGVFGWPQGEVSPR